VSISLGLAFYLHTFLLETNSHSKYDNQIILTYLVNGILAGLIYGLLYYYRYKLKNYVGFLFMGGSFLKFIFFFILFYPAYKADGEMSRLEFFAFFVPYGICLVLETVFTAKMLQKLDETSP
jgi:uncharacterized membrane protein YpjA